MAGELMVRNLRKVALIASANGIHRAGGLIQVLRGA
jgi:hypothetical protein